MSAFFILELDTGAVRFQEGGVAPEGATSVKEEEYRARLAEFVPPPKPTAVSEVSSAQAKIMLARTPGSEDGRSLLDDVKALVEAADAETQIWFSDARTWQRYNLYVEEIGERLRLSEERIDDLFRSASEIAV